MLDYILEWDTELFLYLNNLGSSTWDGFWLFVTHRFSWVPLYLILLGVILYKRGLKKGFIILLFFILLITIVDQTSYHFFKNGLQRLRPCYNENILGMFRLVKDGCGGKFGFFSSHASNSFAFITFITALFQRKMFTWIMVFWACMVSYSRVYVGVHYPLDIICGSLYGILIGFGIKKIFEKYF